MGAVVADIDAFLALNSLCRRTGQKILLVAMLSSEVPEALIEEADYYLECVEAVVTFLKEAATFLERQRG